MNKNNNVNLFKEEYRQIPSNNLNILIVGGSFDKDGGKPSSLVSKIFENLKKISDTQINTNWKISITLFNGGNLNELNDCLQKVENYNVVFWWANVPNEYTKNRNVKEINPKTILVSSKRNDYITQYSKFSSKKYSFQELIQKALELKSNLTVEFTKEDKLKIDSHLTSHIEKLFKMRLFDPLGVVWYEGFDTFKMTEALIERLKFLIQITRQPTIKINDNITIPNKSKFFKYVKECAEIFHEKINPAKDVKRFLGNSSFRCQRGFPSFRTKNYIFVSKRNVDKRYISKENFVPVKFENNNLYYYGENKPSVDTPVQVRLYELLPKINYMIHSHCYTKNGHFTYQPVPCGGIEEVEEIKQIINEEYNGDYNKDFYEINLIGHGCIIMSSNVKKMKQVEFIERKLPEHIIYD